MGASLFARNTASKRCTSTACPWCYARSGLNCCRQL